MASQKPLRQLVCIGCGEVVDKRGCCFKGHKNIADKDTTKATWLNNPFDETELHTSSKHEMCKTCNMHFDEGELRVPDGSNDAEEAYCIACGANRD